MKARECIGNYKDSIRNLEGIHRESNKESIENP